MRGLLILMVAAALSLSFPRLARASDGGTGEPDAGAVDAATVHDAALATDAAGGGDAGVEEDASSSEDAASEVPCPPCALACDGGLCDTTNGSETGGNCSVAPPGTPVGPMPIAAAMGALVLVLARQSRRKAQRGERRMERP